MAEIKLHKRLPNLTQEEEMVVTNMILEAYTYGRKDAQPKWIPVTERLPEDVYGKDREKIVVLVRTKSGNVSQCSRCADYDLKTDATLSQVEWIKNGQFYWSKGKKVTHWMPLPEAPKGE